MREISRLITQLEKDGLRFSLVDDKVSFRGPGALLPAATKEELRARREDVVDFLRARNAAAKLNAPQLKPSEPTASYSQEIWWDRWKDGDDILPAPNIPVSTLFESASKEDVCAALHALLRDTRVLRSHFASRDRKLVAGLNPLDALPVEVVDLSSHPIDDALEIIRARLPAFFSGLIPLGGQWLLKAKLFTIREKMTWLALSVNHLIFDGASQAIILQKLHHMVKNGGAPESDKNGPDFFDYTAFETDVLDDEDGASLIRYWKARADSIPLLHTQTEGRALVWEPGIRCTRSLFFPPSVIKNIQRRARELKTTPFVMHLSVFAMALSVWSGSNHFMLRALGNKRTTSELENIVGLMYCIDTFEIALPSEDNIGLIVERIHAEYRQSLRMRLPTAHFAPPSVARWPMTDAALQNTAPATINFIPRVSSEAAPPATLTAADFWPPEQGDAQRTSWSRPISPIYCHLLEHDSSLEAVFEFNEAVVPYDDQQQFIAAFTEAFEKFGLAPA